MRARLRFLLLYLIFWIGIFIAARLLFLAYHYPRLARLSPATIAAAVLHGARMDLSAAAYIAIFPAILLALSALAAGEIVRRLIAGYTVVVLLLVALLTTIDLELYSAWGFRLDATLLQFLNTPREMLASAGASPVALLLAMLLVLSAASISLFLRGIAPRIARLDRAGAGTFAALLLASAALIVPMRGGVQWTPLNQSTVYFSHDDFANEAALNVGWNFFHSLADRSYARTNPYTSIGIAESERIVDSLLHTTEATTLPLLRIPRPNVIVIIWESLTAKVVQRLGGVPATPHLDSLIRAGVLFDRMYASGDRSAKGLVAILSGFPAEPHVQIINTPNKAARLPTLARDLRGAGYHTAFYYGGELEFANIKSYLLSGGFERIVGKGDFDPKDWNSKWGTHDHVVLRRLLRDTRAAPHPFFTTLLTLSSHEPFDVPASPAASGADEQSRFLIAHRYTDRSIAEFVRAAQRESWWDSTLIVIVADHGHRWPELPVAEAERASWQYHIPMLWLGGALAKGDTVISTIGSQTDLAPTLLAQLGLSGREYRWGKNLLASDARPFAFFAYHDGFGFVDPNGRLVYDETGRRVIEQEGAVGEPEVRSGMAYLRLSYQDYLDK